MSNLDDKFGAWLKMVLPESGTAERDQRIGVIRKFVETVSKEDIIDVVLAFYTAATDRPTTERLRSAMRLIDTSFGPKDGAELAVLAAGVLFDILEKGGALASAAALTVLCADFGALANNNHVVELVTKARQFIGDEGVRLREQSVKLPSLGKALQSALEGEDTEELEDDAAAEGAEKNDSHSDTGLRLVVNALAEYGDKVEQSLASIEARRAEQSDILYWLLSGRRHIAGVPMKDLKKEEAAIFIAIELAKLTRQIPGPASASAILSTLLDQCKNPDTKDVTLAVCVKSIGATDGARYLANQNVVHPVITPVSFALVKAEENGWQDGWENAFKTQTRKSADTEYPVLTIAEQLYREMLVSRALGEK